MSDPIRCIVDASVAIKLFIEQQESDQAEALFEKLSIEPVAQLYVPELFYAECANVLWQYVRRVNYPATEAQASLARLKSLSLQTVAISDLVTEALAIAINHNISAYDACYVALSERLNLPLVTADQKLIRVLSSTEYQIYSLTIFLSLNSV